MTTREEATYVIATRSQFGHLGEFYCGKSYVFQGDRYGVFDPAISKAKMYSTRLRAEYAMNRLRESLDAEMEVVNAQALQPNEKTTQQPASLSGPIQDNISLPSV